MEIGPHLSLNQPLHLPVRVRIVDHLPKILAAGIPITPLNFALRDRQHYEGATRVSLETYARAGRLYVEFCARRECSLLDVTNEEFLWFKRALLGEAFPDAQGQEAFLSGRRGKRTADLMLTLMYSLAADISERYDVTFDWRRFKGIPSLPPDPLDQTSRPSSAYTQRTRRTHRIKWVPRKILGLPDEQFAHLLRTAYARWGNEIADGDRAWADDPEAQRGALFYRNLAMLLVLRYAGSRRSEVVQVRFTDIDQEASLIYLETKGHRIEAGQRLPVLLFPWVRDILWLYATSFRPVMSRDNVVDQQAIFVSHSVRNYGKPVSDQSVRALIDVLRSALDPPWNEQLTPHTLRHAFGYDLQRLGGSSAVTTNMRHASSRSGEPYQAGPELLADSLLPVNNQRIEQLLAQAGLREVLIP